MRVQKTLGIVIIAVVILASISTRYTYIVSKDEDSSAADNDWATNDPNTDLATNKTRDSIGHKNVVNDTQTPGDYVCQSMSNGEAAELDRWREKELKVGFTDICSPAMYVDRCIINKSISGLPKGIVREPIRYNVVAMMDSSERGKIDESKYSYESWKHLPAVAGAKPREEAKGVALCYAGRRIGKNFPGAFDSQLENFLLPLKEHLVL